MREVYAEHRARNPPQSGRPLTGPKPTSKRKARDEPHDTIPRRTRPLADAPTTPTLPGRTQFTGLEVLEVEEALQDDAAPPPEEADQQALHPNPYRNITEKRPRKPTKIPSPYKNRISEYSATDAEIRYINEQSRIERDLDIAQREAERAAAEAEKARIQQELRDFDRILNPKYNGTLLKCPHCGLRLYRNNATFVVSFYCKEHGTIEKQNISKPIRNGEHARERGTPPPERTTTRTTGTSVVVSWPRVDPITKATYTLQHIKDAYSTRVSKHVWFTPPDGSCLCHSIQKQFTRGSHIPSLQQMRSAMFEFLSNTTIGQVIARQHYEDDTRAHHSLQDRIHRVLYRDQYCSYMEIKALVNIYNLRLTIHEICSPGTEGDLSSLQQWDVTNTTYIPDTPHPQEPLEMHVLLAALHYEALAQSPAATSVSFENPSSLPRPLIDTNEYTPAALKAISVSKQILNRESIGFSCDSTTCQIHQQQNQSCCNTCESDGIIHCGQRDGDIICSSSCHRNCMLQRAKGYLHSATFIRQIPHQPNGFLGLFAGENIHPRDFIGEYCGRVSTLKEHDRNLTEDPNYNTDYATITKLGPKCVINAHTKGSAMCYANNSHNPNTDILTIYQDGQYRQYLRARRFIPYGEEITIDYGWIWDETRGRRPTRCICQAPGCGGYLEKGYQPKRTLEQFWGGGQTSSSQPNTKKAKTQAHTTGESPRNSTKVAEKKRKLPSYPPTAETTLPTAEAPEELRPAPKRTKPPDILNAAQTMSPASGIHFPVQNHRPP